MDIYTGEVKEPKYLNADTLKEIYDNRGTFLCDFKYYKLGGNKIEFKNVLCRLTKKTTNLYIRLYDMKDVITEIKIPMFELYADENGHHKMRELIHIGKNSSYGLIFDLIDKNSNIIITYRY